MKQINFLFYGESVKQCTTCGKTKTLDRFNKQSSGKYGVVAYCKQCNVSRAAKYYSENRTTLLDYKKKERLENIEIHRRRDKENYQKHKEQISDRSKIYYEKNKIKISERAKIYNDKNKENHRIKGLEYRIGKREHLKLRARKYRSENNELVRERGRENYKRNKEKIKEQAKSRRPKYRARTLASNKKRKADKILATPIWYDHKKAVEIYKKSVSLRDAGNLVHVDHYYPLHGETVCGLHVHDNLIIIGATENMVKGNSHPDEFYDDQSKA